MNSLTGLRFESLTMKDLCKQKFNVYDSIDPDYLNGTIEQSQNMESARVDHYFLSNKLNEDANFTHNQIELHKVNRILLTV